MNGHLADIAPYVAGLQGCAAVICPPMPLLAPMAIAVRGTGLQVGGQDCHAEAAGAFTGASSAMLLAELGCSHVIVGHSERRRDAWETDDLVWAKANQAHAAGLVPIVCVGEKDGEDFEAVLQAQIAGTATYAADSLILAYEPVWAISANKTGRTPTPADIENRHKYIAVLVEKMRPSTRLTVLYGGSVNPENAAVILATAGVGGVLVGGASLKAASFKAIIEAAPLEG